VTFLGQFGGRALGAVGLMIVLRHITQEEFGALSFGMSIVGVASTIHLTGVNWRFVGLIAQSLSDPAGQAKIVRQHLSITLASGVVTAAAILMLGPHLFAMWQSGERLSEIWPYLSLAVLTTSLGNFSLVRLQGKQQFSYAAWLTFLQSASTLVCYALMLLFRAVNFSTVLLTMSVVPVLPLALTLASSWHQILDTGTPSGIVVSKSSTDEHWYVGYGVLAVVAGQLDVQMMSYFFSLRDVGIYSVAGKLYGMFILGLTSIHIVLRPRFSTLKDPSEFRKASSNMLRLTVPAAIVVTAGTLVFAQQIVGFIAGVGYQEAVIPLRILSVSAGLSLVFAPFVNVLFALGQIKLVTISGAIAVVLLCFGHLVVTRNHGAVGAAVVTLVGYCVANGFVFINAIRLTRRPLIQSRTS